MAKRGDYPIPFDRKGNQLHYADEYYNIASEWRENFEFTDTLTYTGYTRGRSAAYFGFEGSDGKSYTMFLKDFEEAIREMVKGSFSGVFTFTKRGQNYGVRFVRSA